MRLSPPEKSLKAFNINPGVITFNERKTINHQYGNIEVIPAWQWQLE
jgi:predicted AAA+ superfamily ATPase